MGSLEIFPQERTRALSSAQGEPASVHALPGVSLHPAGAAAASESSKESGAGLGVPRVVLPPLLKPKDHPNLRLLETAATLVSLARTAASGDFSEDVHRAAVIVSRDLTLIGVCEHDTSLLRACSLLVTALIEMSEADSERREIWSRALPTMKGLVRELHFALCKRMGVA